MESFKIFQELWSSRCRGGGDLRQGMCGRKRLLHTQIGVGTSQGPSQKSSNLRDPSGKKDDLELARSTNQNWPGIFEAVR
jgi:hypothetical protein